jgi:TolB protein
MLCARSGHGVIAATLVVLSMAIPSGTTAPDECLEERVAFTSTRDLPSLPEFQNGGEIYLMNADGTDVVRVTDNLVLDAFGDLRPDGKRIVFDSNRLRAPGESVLMSDLFVMKTDGSEQTFVARGSSADWSPDGKRVTFHASASGLTDPIRPDPGGPTIDSDIFIVNVGAALDEGGRPTNITNTPTDIEEDPNWSPNGEKIVYTRFNVDDNHLQPAGMEIFVVNADGSGTPTQLTFNSSEERAPAWSPDGTRIVFMCRYGGVDFEICIMDADGSNLVQLTDNAVQELSLRWSLDGNRFFFNRPVAPMRQEIFSINVDGTGETQLPSPPTSPPQGTTLFPAPGLLRVQHKGGPCDGAVVHVGPAGLRRAVR